MLDVRNVQPTHMISISFDAGAILLLALSVVRVLVARCLCNVCLWNIVVIRTWCDYLFTDTVSNDAEHMLHSLHGKARMR
jgi:hypothetical protein